MKKVLSILLSVVFVFASMTLVAYAFDTPSDTNTSVQTNSTLQSNLSPIVKPNDTAVVVLPDFEQYEEDITLMVTSKKTSDGKINVTITIPTTISDTVSSGSITLFYDNSYMTYSGVSGKFFGYTISTSVVDSGSVAYSYPATQSAQARIVVSVVPDPNGANKYSVAGNYTLIFTPVGTLEDGAKSVVTVSGISIKTATLSDMSVLYNFVPEQGKEVEIAYCEHLHTQQMITIPATCRAEGLRETYCSDCGLKVNETFIPKTSHTFPDKPVNIKKAPTCTESGIGEFVCQICKQTGTMSIPALGHQWGEPFKIADVYYVRCTIHTDVIEISPKQCEHDISKYVLTNVTKTPTCESTGIGDYTCSVCQSVMYDQVLPKGDHLWEDVRVVYEATQYQNGLKLQVCTVCQLTRYISFSDTSHTTHDYSGDETILIQPTCTKPGLKSVQCTGCAKTISVDIPALGHDWSSVEVEIAATCTQPGLEKRTCLRCGLVDEHPANPLGHDWGDWVVSKQANCTEDGEQSHTCKRCSEVEKQTIEKLGHNWSEWATTSEATCTQDGLRKHTCSRCNSIETETIEKLGHNWSSWSVNSVATCTVDGSEIRICQRCNEVETKVIEKLGHDWGDWVVIEAGSCTVPKVEERTCKRCSEKEINQEGGLGHKWNETVVMQAPTCDTAGYGMRVCPVCSTLEKVDLPALGHAWSEWITGVDATCLEAGAESRICSRCNLVEDRVVEALGHDYIEFVTNPTCTEQGYSTFICSRCGDYYDDKYTEALGHKWDEGQVIKDPTCEEKGTKVYKCALCNELMEEDIDALGHDYSEWTVASTPTCTEDGQYERVCSRCGGKDYEVIEKLGHNYGDWNVIIEPTCESEGLRSRTCQRCDYVDTEVVDPLGHAFSDWVVVTEATCTTVGVKTRKCFVCGLNVKEEIPTIEHTFGEWQVVQEGDCTHDKVSIRQCTVCKVYTERDVVTAPGHDFGEWEPVSTLSCTEDEARARTCKKCGEQEIDVITPHEGHKYSEWTTRKAATCTQAGEEYRTCSVCNFEDTREIEKLPHTFDEENGYQVVTPATCKTTGVEECVCSVCGIASIKRTIPINTNAHDFNEWQTTTVATCTTPGIETRTCKICLKVETRTTSVTGHTFGPSETVKNGTQKKCSVCGTTETILTVKDVTTKQESNDIFTLVFTNPSEVNGTIIFYSNKLSNEEYNSNVLPAEVELKNQGQTVIGAYKQLITINGKEAGVDSASSFIITLPSELSSTDVRIWYRTSTGLSPLNKDSYTRSKNVITVDVKNDTFDSQANIIVLTNAGKYSQVNVLVPIVIAVVSVLVVVGLVLFLRRRDKTTKVDDDDKYSSTDM